MFFILSLETVKYASYFRIFRYQRGDMMLTLKRIFLASGILCVIGILGWTIWYSAIVRPKLVGKPVMRYNTKPQITADDKVDTAVGKKSQIGKNTQEDGTAETHKHPVREGTENATLSSTQKESDQQAHSSETHQHSEEELAKWEQEKKS